MFICKRKCFCVHTVYFIYIFRWDFSRVIVLHLFDYSATLWPVRKLSKSNFTDEFSRLTYQARAHFVLHREGVDLPRLSVTLFCNNSCRCLEYFINLTLIHINVFSCLYFNDCVLYIELHTSTLLYRILKYKLNESILYVSDFSCVYNK